MPEQASDHEQAITLINEEGRMRVKVVMKVIFLETRCSLDQLPKTPQLFDRLKRFAAGKHVPDRPSGSTVT